MVVNEYDRNRQKYLPPKVRILFIAEAPPEDRSRFFYFENVKSHDALFINLVRILYPEYQSEHGSTVNDIRANKPMILETLKADGYFLIDALSEPISLKLSSKERERLITSRKRTILEAIKKLKPEVGVILIKSTVNNGLRAYLVEQGVNVLNGNSVPFPSYGHLKVFKQRIHEALALSDEKYRWRTRFTWYDGNLEITKLTGSR